MPLQFNEDKQNKQLKELHAKEEEELAQLMSTKYGVQYVNLAGIPINNDSLKLIDEKTSRETRMVGFSLVGKRLSVAVQSPSREDTQAVLKKLESEGYQIITYITSIASLEKAWGRYKDISFSERTKAGSLEISDEQIQETISNIKSIDDARLALEGVLGQDKRHRISKIVEVLMAGAIAIGASDVHVEPEEDFVRVRYRLDGVLTLIGTINHATHHLLLSRIKLLSKLKLNVKKAAQDGRFSVNIADVDIEIRTSTLPGPYGESIVMRVLNPDSINVTLPQLGLSEQLLSVFAVELNRPNGLILNTGPTGSGKTTTLYSFLTHKKSPGTKIITIEDPIEYHLEGIVQTQVNKQKNYTFATGLRASLRQDPDMIMVGEIRDTETAEIAIHSALTGHLVFSTLHTNNAAGTFPRLTGLGMEPNIISSALNVAIAQRLVRKLCKECKQEIPIPEERIEQIKTIFAHTPNNPVSTIPKTIYGPQGCTVCNDSGYKGRVGIFELILAGAEIDAVLEKRGGERDIMLAARTQEIPTLQEDAVIKILRGITSLDELDRVIELDTTIYKYIDQKLT